MFKHILLPTDGSKLSEKAIRNSVRVAKALGARITALHVVPKFHAFKYPMEMLDATRDQAAKAAERGRHYLEFAGKVARAAGVECDGVQTSGDQPYKEIIKTAQKKGCDVILMASHGRRGIEGLLLGSETQKVLTHSTVPVLVYR